MDIYSLLKKVRNQKPLVHHITNWVTIYDCANIVKTLGASPVMAHAKEEVQEMTSLASSLVLNIGTLTSELVEAMILAGKAANKKGIPIVLDACGAGATSFRNEKCFELLQAIKIDIIKGNSSEIARLAGEEIQTKGVDAVQVEKDLIHLAKILAQEKNCTAVITGAEDIIADHHGHVFQVKNGHEIMSRIVGTGCMAASVIGTFAGVEKDFSYAAASGLCCYEIAAELAALHTQEPGTFKVRLFDFLSSMDEVTIEKRKKVC
jgi:hydroxyethylthiazole kinase